MRSTRAADGREFVREVEIMGEDLCCDEWAQAIRDGAVEFEGDEVRIVDERGIVVVYNVRFCPHCGEALV